MDFTQFIDKTIEEDKLLSESTALEVTKKAFIELANVSRRLSESFSIMAKYGNTDGDGDIPEVLRKAEVAIQNAKNTIKTIKRSDDKIEFDSSVKKVLGEIGSSLQKVQARITKEIIPAISLSPEEDVTNDEENIFTDHEDE